MGRSLAMKSLLPLAAILALGVNDAAAAGVRALRVGASVELVLDGNPSTGYRWIHDAAASVNAGRVEIESLGYRAPSRQGARPLIGAPAPFVLKLSCVRAGTARLVFAYVGPTGHRSDKTRIERVRCR